jgi:hypothetical protein
VRRLVSAAVATVALVVAGTSAAAAATTNDSLVQAWYRVYLGRTAADTAADPGRAYWVSRLDEGAPRSTVLAELLDSREYVTREIRSYYVHYLGRQLDAGAAYWIDGVVHGDFVAEWAAQLVLGSQEYQGAWTGRAADPDAALIRALYFDLLHRSATDGDVNYWRGALGRTGRFAVVRGIWYADEAVRVRVDGNYRAILGHPVGSDPAAGYWTPIEVTSDHTVRAELGATGEFEARYAALG